MRFKARCSFGFSMIHDYANSDRHFVNFWPYKWVNVPKALQSDLLREMKFLLGAGLSALITYVFVSIALFTQRWVSAAVNAVYATVKQSAGVFPWGCVSDNSCGFFWDYADGWAITVFLAMLFAWIVQFFVLLSVVIALVLPRWRYHLTRGFTSQQLVVTLLLLYVLIVYGSTYDRNTQVFNTFGVDVYLDYSYWLCLVGTIFSLATLVLGGTAIKNDDRDYH